VHKSSILEHSSIRADCCLTATLEQFSTDWQAASRESCCSRVACPMRLETERTEEMAVDTEAQRLETQGSSELRCQPGSIHCKNGHPLLPIYSPT